ncbi:uncharacterized protein LOC141856383 [Brevipalpus obovatus]|uniref:uncharacterized protein LOC141856383 n=1 Tax=Brevipalpus obovatus TaxID=246614 RepID=UPI003D9F029A
MSLCNNCVKFLKLNGFFSRKVSRNHVTSAIENDARSTGSDQYSSSSFQDIVEEIFTSGKRSRFIQHPQAPPRYYFEDHVRYVYPYVGVFQKSCSRENHGRSVCDVANDNLRNLSGRDVCYAILNGFIRVNRKKVELDHVMKFDQVLSFVWHHHEPGNLAVKPKLIYRDDEIYVIDKPPSIPIHPMGSSSGFNSLIRILRFEQQIEVNPLYRLDAPTSGLLILTFSSNAHRKYLKILATEKVEKTYLAEVMGDFPEGETIVDVPILLDLHTNIVMVDKVFGKSSKTRFKKLETRTETSLIECILETGRTHQIRVHLQYLGYPIKNDRVYSSKEIFGPNLAKGGDYQFLNESEILPALRKNEYDNSEKIAVINHYSDPEFQDHIEKNKYETNLDKKFKDCIICMAPMDPRYMHQKILHLHALRYRTKFFDFQTKPPFWA